MNTNIILAHPEDIAFLDRHTALRTERDGVAWTRTDTLHDIIQIYQMVQESVDEAFDTLLRQTVLNFIKEVADSKDDIDPETMQRINDLFAKYEQIDEFDEQEAGLFVTGKEYVQ